MSARPQLVEGLLAAAGLAALTAIAAWLLPAILPTAGLDPLLALVAGVYVIYLGARAPAGIGRVAVPVAWAVLSIAGAWLLTSAAAFAAFQLMLIWLARSLLFQRSLAAAGVDAALVAAGGALAMTALTHGHSLAVASWCLFLLQAPFASAPFVPLPDGRRRSATPEDPFEAAARRADAALQAHARAASHRGGGSHLRATS